MNQVKKINSVSEYSGVVLTTIQLRWCACFFSRRMRPIERKNIEKK
jgi:hypothetical protein